MHESHLKIRSGEKSIKCNECEYASDRAQSLFYFVPQENITESHRQAGSFTMHQTSWARWG